MNAVQRVGCSPGRYSGFRRRSPNLASGRSVTDMDHSRLSWAIATLVVALGPTATSSGASAATTTNAAVYGPLQLSTTRAGNVVAVVPGASFAGDDHLPAKLDRKHTYHATFVMWAAPNARHPVLKVRTIDGTARHCSHSKIRPGAATYLTCDVRPNAKHQIAASMTIAVVIGTSNLGTYSHSYRHQITN